MKFQRFLSLFLVLLACFVRSSHCNTFYVGGKEGWVLHPKEMYSDWAGKQRFQVNDVLIFKYEKGSDSVLLVTKDDYYKCERKHPLMEMSNGTSEFKFPHSGPFYFISGKEDHCSKGQKMIAVVMAEKHQTPPSIHPPIVKPPGKSPYPGPAQSPEHHGPVAKPPTGSTPGPAQSPYTHVPISSPPSSVPTGSPPVAHGPTHSPAPSTHHAPQYGPSQSPVAHGPTANPPKSTSTSPSSSSPQGSTPAGLSPAPSTGSGLSPPAPPQGTSPSPSTTTSPSGSQTSTPPKGSSATATYSSVLVLASSVLFCSMIF
ncbi:early nodulin-like protein 2 isoform X2 [Hibiscus syriacus]|uniref:early nodulin-like protein 2 isoform X2 n=1 Tax=Hibiscus syriacus TaxID=106335 RepID=UPI001924C81D|nr:early nodulin-like protein 2 isoform X2 [Hibiscus syriacus]